jgi:hypothetical protein
MDIQTLLQGIGDFMDGTVIELIMAIAFVYFIWNTYRYFILGGANPESQEKAKAHALWGIVAFAVIVSLWGLVNLLVGGFGLSNGLAPTPDYFQ